MSKNTITCKKCGSEIEISEALTHQIREQILASLDAKHKQDLEVAKKEATEEVSKKVHEQFEAQLKNLQKANEEEQERNKKLTGQINQLLLEMRKLRRKDEDREIEMKKKILEEEEKIRTEAIKKTEEEHRLKDLEKDKKLQDTLKQVEELKTKMEQGSQQSQGEVLELEMEKILKHEFPSDNIAEIKKGERGADIVQTVIDRNGKTCGIIIWESKNAKWSNLWIDKLKEDQRRVKAQVAALVSVHIPEDISGFVFRNGAWISNRSSFVGLAYALRFQIIQAFYIRTENEGKNEKKDIVYKYFTGIEFQHRVEAIVQAFDSLKKDIETERRWFQAKWARQEKIIRTVIDNTHGIYGELQAITGKELAPIQSLEPPEDSEG